MYPTELGTAFTVMQTVLSGNIFDGTDWGRASLTVGSGSSRVTVKRKTYGSEAIRFGITAPTGGTIAATSVTLSGLDVIVTARQNGGSLLATATEVALAINAKENCPIVAVPWGNGVVATAGLTTLTGGIGTNTTDPGVFLASPTPYRFDMELEASKNGGGLFFENTQPTDYLIIRQIEAMFYNLTGTAIPVSFELCDMDAGLVFSTGRSIPFYETTVVNTSPSVTISDIRLIVGPYQGIRILCATDGYVRIMARREAKFPYL